MSITPQTLSSIQKAGEAIEAARQALAHAVTEHAQRVMGAIKHNPTHPDNEKSLEDWKALTQLAHEVETAEQQFRAIYFTAEQMVMQEVQVLPALAHQSASPKESTSTQSVIQDVIAKPVIKRAKKSKMTIVTASSASPAIKLSKNDKKVLDHLKTLLSGSSWTRLTLQNIALGAGIPNGSSAASMNRLLKAKQVEIDAQGQYRLV